MPTAKYRMSRFDQFLILAVVGLLIASAGWASEPTDDRFSYPANFDPGTPIATSIRETLFTTIPPDGSGLPAGSGNFESGRLIYQAKCVACHGDKLQGTEAGLPLVGGRGTLTSDSPKKTVESFWPYATSVFSYIRNTMPVTAPGTLTDDETYALMAFILGSAGITQVDAVMNKVALAAVRMPNRHGFIRDDRPDVAAVRVND